MSARNRLVLTALAWLVSFPVGAADDPSETLATLNGQAITRADVMEVTGSQLRELEQQEYNLLKQGVESIANRRLVEAAAKAAGKTLDEYIASEIDAKVPAPTEEEVQAFYERYKNHQNLRGKSLEEVRGMIVDNISGNKKQELINGMLGRLRSGAKLNILLDPPRIEVGTGENNPSWGPKDAKVTIVEFSDFQCSFCRRVESTLEKVKEVYGDRVRFVFRDFPLSFHPQAQKAAEAGGCAHDQGKFWQLSKLLFENQQALSVGDIKNYASQAGLDVARFSQCLDSDKYREEVLADMRAGQAVGVTGTPAFFINGRMLSGAASFEQFAEIIDDEIGRTGSASAK